MITIIVGLVYLVILGWLVLHLIKLYRYPEQYMVIPNYDVYKQSCYYWKGRRIEDAPWSHPIHRDSGKAIGYAIIIGEIFFYYVTILEHHLLVLSMKEGVKFSNYEGWGAISIIYVGYYCFVLGFYYPLFSKKPLGILASIASGARGQKRVYKWKMMTWIVLISTMVLFPIRIFQINNIGYANHDEIVYRPFGSLKDQRFVFNELEDVEIEYAEDGITVIQCQLQNKEGQIFEVCREYRDIDFAYNSHYVSDYILSCLEDWYERK